MESLEYWLWLRLVPGIGSITERKLLEHFGDPKSIYDADLDQLQQVEGIGAKLAAKLHSDKSLDKARHLKEKLHKHGIKTLTIHHPSYPQQLLQYAKAPTILYYKGAIKDTISSVAIVGARRCTSYGKQLAAEAANYLATYQIPVISGLAKGIDSYAHTACIKRGGYTLAVVGHGLDLCYPNEHRELMQAVIETGAVISEYPPGTKPRPEHFPQRNGIIAGLSSKVLIVEAAEKSGALITAELAKEQGKELLVAPHEIYSQSGKGCNQLIRAGAAMYLHLTQLIDNLVINQKTGVSSDFSLPIQELTGKEKKIRDCLLGNPKTLAEISKETDINEIELMEVLTIMELEGHIQMAAGGRYGVFVTRTQNLPLCYE